MTKRNKLRTGIFAIAMVLMCNLTLWAQSGRESAPTPATKASKSVQKNTAATELKNFKADPSNPGLSKAQLSLLQAKAALEANQSENTLTPQQVNILNTQIAAYESRINKLQPKGKDVNREAASSNPEVNSLQMSLDQAKAILSDKNQTPQQISDLQNKIANMEARLQKLTAIEKGTANTVVSQKTAVAHPVNDILDAKQFTRTQFLALTEPEQRQVLVNMKDLTITDLVNATPAVLKVRQDNLFYIPAADFKTYDIPRQTQILKNPSLYIMVKEASMIPKAQISRASFNALSPEKQRAIENSNDFVIIN